MSWGSAVGGAAPTYDVDVVGGGASEAHAAVTLKDRGLDVVVIEANDRLGDHAEIECFLTGLYID